MSQSIEKRKTALKLEVLWESGPKPFPWLIRRDADFKKSGTGVVVGGGREGSLSESGRPDSSLGDALAGGVQLWSLFYVAAERRLPWLNEVSLCCLDSQIHMTPLKIDVHDIFHSKTALEDEDKVEYKQLRQNQWCLLHKRQPRRLGQWLIQKKRAVEQWINKEIFYLFQGQYASEIAALSTKKDFFQLF